MFGLIEGDLTVFVHETGHSLDRLGAYSGTNNSFNDDNASFADSSTWLKNYAEDSHVPDPYAQTNQAENLAQNTVVATYDLNVPGGFPGVEPKWRGLRNQLATMRSGQAKEGAFLVKGGLCTKRLANNEVVRKDGRSSRLMMRSFEEPPDVGLSDSVEVIEPVEFDTKEDCLRGF